VNAVDERRLALERAHNRFRRAVSGLDSPVLETVPAVGVWTVRDLVAHLVDWGEETLLAIDHVLGGPPVQHHPIVDFEAFNAASAARHCAEPWDSLYAKLDDLFRRSLALVERLSPEQLALPVDYPWDDTGTLDGLLRGIDEHQEEHNEQLEAWRRRLRRHAGDGVPAT
jgi:hypothetical protein